MTINKITNDNGASVFALDGRLDTATAPELTTVLMPEFGNVSEVVVDLTGVNYVSSAGLRTLLAGHKEALKKGGSLRITGVCPEVKEVFDMTGFSDILTIL
jgi:anti-sigma B factor antagonist